MRSRVLRVALLIFATLGASQSRAQVLTMDSMKAAFLHRFASYIEWPKDALGDRQFVIAVVGAEEVATELDALLPRMAVHGRTAQVRRITRVEELAGVHILYVGPGVLSRTRKLRTVALGRPILIVTDDVRGLDAGGVINFLEADGNVRFEISLTAADRAQLKIDSSLLSVAARVERRPQAWVPADRANEHRKLAVKGFNLLNETQREYADPNGREIRRSVMAELRYNY